MFYLKILLLSFIPALMFGQGYYAAEGSNSFYQLLLNDNKTFSYTEQSPIGKITVSITGSYSYVSNVQIKASGRDTRNNTSQQIIISLRGKYAELSIYGQKRSLTKR
jgi:hypothetical protein